MDKPHHDLERVYNEDEQSFLARVKDNLDKLEIIRKEKLAKYISRKKIGIPAALILTPICGYLDWLLLLWQRGNDDSGAGITFVMLGIVYSWVTHPKRQYTKAYKKEILPKLAATLGLVYNPKGKIPMALLKPSQIVPKHDKYKTEDYFEGSYKNVAVKFSEINLKQRRRSKKRTYYVSVFKGLAILLEMDRKKFNGHTILQQDKARFFEWFKEKSTGLQRAHLVDPEFEKIFDAYTNDQTEARYLVDPLIIEELKTLSADYEGNRMMVAYYNSHVLVMIATKHNQFEPADIHVKATAPESVRNMRNDIKQILSLIDRLDLYDPYALQAEQDNVIKNPEEEQPPKKREKPNDPDDDGIPDGQVML